MNVPIVNDTVRSIDPTKIPTSDVEIKALLRQFGEPITYFGEDSYDRRQRLIKVVKEMPNTNFGDNFEVEEDAMDELSDELELDDEFYTPGSQELLDFRKSVLTFSLNKAKKRVQQQRDEYEEDFVKILKHRRSINDSFSKTELYGSQLIPNNKRAISTIRYNETNDKIACGSWDGNLYILNTELELIRRLVPGYHTEKTSGLDWKGPNIITGGNEGTVNYWNTDTSDEVMSPTNTIEKAHEARIVKALYHPNGQNFITASFDQTWKLWDLETSTDLMQQEGHSKEVFSASFHPDGSTLSTGGLDAIVKLWDMRSGKLITNLTSHIQGIYSMDWNLNGYYLATGSGDSSVKIWDLRSLDSSQKEIFSIPAHTKIVSDVRFQDHILVTSSYDGNINVWSADNWIKVAQLQSPDKVMSCDIANSTIISSHWDKSIKLWTTI